MRGDKEQQCLDIIKNDKKIEDSRKYFCCSEEDVKEIVQAVKNAEQNNQLSCFPDFIFPDGFIEHFKITSAKTNKKGSIHAKQESEFKRKVKIESMRMKEKWSQDLNNEQIHSQSWAMKYPEHNYDHLYQSFIQNWQKHIQSMNKYNGNKDISIFMIEYSDSALEMYENVFEDWVDGMSNGDMREPERVETYRITRDKKILKFLYNNRDSIKYVIFVYEKKYEIIKLANIQYLLKLMPWEYVIAPYMGTTLISTLREIGEFKPYMGGDIDSEQDG